MPSATEFMEKFQTFIEKCPEDYVYALEVRNQNYLNEAYFSFLKNLHLAPVFLQGYYMPDIFPLYHQYEEFIQEDVIIRLHGPQRQEMEKLTGKVWNRIVAQKDTEIEALIHMIKDIKQKQVTVFVNVNNHYEGSAPLTIQRIYNGAGDLLGKL